MISNSLPASILIIDDQPESLLLLESWLSSAGYFLVTASTGERGIDCAIQEIFSLIILDVKMSGLNSLETAIKIRTESQCQSTPMIFLTNLEIDDSQIDQGYELGVVDYIFKPINPKLLNKKVSIFIQLFQQQQQLEQQNLSLKKLSKMLVLNILGQRSPVEQLIINDIAEYDQMRSALA